MAKTGYVKCGLTKGFFDEELYVFVGSSSAIVNREAVRIFDEPKQEVEGRGEVCVYLLEQTPDRLLVEIPGQPVVGGLRTWIPKNDLAAA